jgi:glutathione synthase
MRQDPPFDMAYITATHLLELLPANGPLVVNDPAAVRNAPEKLFVLKFKDLMPPTLLSLDADEIRAFWEEHGDIILKPLFGHAGAGIVHLRPGDENLNSLLEMYAQIYREPVMVQRYVPEVRNGDKRIILIDGEPAGAVLRIPVTGEARANFHAGGRAGKTVLTLREKEICAAIGPTLKEQGLLFVGIDVLGDYITEINVTCPTGIQEISRLNDDNLAAKVWDAIEAKIADRNGRRPA